MPKEPKSSPALSLDRLSIEMGFRRAHERTRTKIKHTLIRPSNPISFPEKPQITCHRMITNCMTKKEKRRKLAYSCLAQITPCAKGPRSSAVSFQGEGSGCESRHLL